MIASSLYELFFTVLCFVNSFAAALALVGVGQLRGQVKAMQKPHGTP